MYMLPRSFTTIDTIFFFSSQNARLSDTVYTLQVHRTESNSSFDLQAHAARTKKFAVMINRWIRFDTGSSTLSKSSAKKK